VDAVTLADLTVAFGLKKQDLRYLTMGEIAEYLSRLPGRGEE
jgi:hypothetical protein